MTREVSGSFGRTIKTEGLWNVKKFGLVEVFQMNCFFSARTEEIKGKVIPLQA
jgi:hypothetical protein